MAGEMTQQDIEKGGDWYELREMMENFAERAGFDYQVKPFDQYQGPYCELKVENLCVAELWVDFGTEEFILSVVNAGKKVKQRVDDPDDIRPLVLDVWEEWNQDYLPDYLNEEDNVKVMDGYLELTNENDELEKYEESPITDELAIIVKHYKEKVVKYDNKYYFRIQ